FLQVENAVLEVEPFDARQRAADVLDEPATFLDRDDPGLPGVAELPEPGPVPRRVGVSPCRFRVRRQSPKVGADEIPETVEVVLGLHDLDRDLITFDSVAELHHRRLSLLLY